MLFYLKKFLTALILPPTSLLLLTIAGLAIASMSRRRRLGLGLAWVGSGTLLLLSVPLTEDLLTRAIADAVVIAPQRLADAQAIVILGGGLRREQMEYGTDAPTAFTLERLRYGAFLARRSRLPVLVSGGRVFEGGRTEADVMGAVLESEFHVPVRWREERSRNTHENALYSARILKQAGITRVIVVSHAVDSRRARREFRAEGLEVTIAPTLIPESENGNWLQQMPSMRALHGSTLALYEIVANAAMTLGLNGS